MPNRNETPRVDYEIIEDGLGGRLCIIMVGGVIVDRLVEHREEPACWIPDSNPERRVAPDDLSSVALELGMEHSTRRTAEQAAGAPRENAQKL